MSRLSNARTELENYEKTRPADYVSQYQPKIKDVMGQLDGMKEFDYDPDADTAYQQYKSQYTDGVKRTIDFRSAPNVTNDCYFFRFAEKDGSKTVIIVEVVAKMVDRFKYSNKEATVVSEVSR